MLRLAASGADAMVGALADAIDNAERPGTISLYAGRMPRIVENRTAEMLMARLEFGKPAFEKPELGSIVARPIADTTARASGRVGWARIADGAGNAVFDCDVGAPDAPGTQDATIQLNTANMAQGGPVMINRCVITQPRE